MIYENSGERGNPIADLRILADYVDWLERRVEALQDARREAYKLLMVGYDPAERGVFFVPRLNFNVYEALLTPTERFMDVKTAEDGYENLLYKNRPVSWADGGS